MSITVSSNNQLVKMVYIAHQCTSLLNMSGLLVLLLFLNCWPNRSVGQHASKQQRQEWGHTGFDPLWYRLQINNIQQLCYAQWPSDRSAAVARQHLKTRQLFPSLVLIRGELQVKDKVGGMTRRQKRSLPAQHLETKGTFWSGAGNTNTRTSCSFQ